MNARKMKPLGEVQLNVLRCLKDSKPPCWHEGCGWIWDCISGTIRIMESLEKRGLVNGEMLTTPGKGRRRYVYTLTAAGREAWDDSRKPK